MHRYSLGNVLLIAAQRPEATYVAGYRVWQELGRQVRKGERGIAIFVPHIYRPKTDGETASQDDDRPSPHLFEQQASKPLMEAATAVLDQKPSEPSRIRFGIGYVFDVAQTDGPELAGQWGYLTGDAETAKEAIRKLEYFATTLGYTIDRDDEPGRVRGHCDHKARRIVLDSALDAPNQAATLAHELAHALLHDGITDYRERRAVNETEAESAAYAVVVGLGFDPTSCQLPYVAGWTGGDVTMLREAAKRVQTTASKLLDVAEATEKEAA
jgi:antirestriction protein ArdC